MSLIVTVQRAFRLRYGVLGVLWGYLKAEVYKDRPRTLEELKHNILPEIGRLPIAMLETVERNFRNHLHHCIENGGRHLNGVLFETT
jgi:hypothetical protein